MDEHVSRRFQSTWLIILAVLTFVGCLTALVSDLLGWLAVDRHNPISETISKLAIGKHAWIQDVGLDVFAGGLVACAIGLLLWNLGGWRWHAAAALQVLTAVDVVVIAEYNQYAGFDGFGGMVHMTCVYVLYALVAVTAGFLAFELRAVSRRYFWSSLAFVAFWLVGGPLFLFAAPTDIDGAFERLLALGWLSWISMIAWLLLQQGRRLRSVEATPARA